MRKIIIILVLVLENPCMGRLRAFPKATLQVSDKGKEVDQNCLLRFLFIFHKAKFLLMVFPHLENVWRCRDLISASSNLIESLRPNENISSLLPRSV